MSSPFRTFEDAIKEKPGFDDEKKELIYNRPACSKKWANARRPSNSSKSSTALTIGYKDVAKKVDDFYSGQNVSFHNGGMPIHQRG